MGVYHFFTIIVFLSALFSYINYRFIRLPQTIGIMILALTSSILLVVFGRFVPYFETFAKEVSAIDFNTLLMKIMLGFLLFAGGFHINAKGLKKERLPVIVLAIVGTILSSFIVGGLSFYLFGILHFNIPFIYCLLFGTLISPTDPIAVLGILKESRISSSLELKISGESLFNDGVAVVFFITISESAGSGGEAFSLMDTALLFLREAGGGVAYGLLLGYLGFLALRSIDNYKVEILITLTLVMTGYYLADIIHVSGPLAMVVAGIFTGNKGREAAMSDDTRDYLSRFWELIDEILNAVLFLLIGLEMLVVNLSGYLLLAGALLIAVVLFARWISVFLPVKIMGRWISFERNAIAVLTWGGLRGGISVALALSLPAAFHREIFVSVTYIIVVFSILVQGLTIGRVAQKLA